MITKIGLPLLRVDDRDGFSRPRRFSLGFEAHAAPEAIQAYIDKARSRSEAIQNELGWLEGLYLRRVAEKAAGQWPAAASSGTEET